MFLIVAAIVLVRLPGVGAGNEFGLPRGASSRKRIHIPAVRPELGLYSSLYPPKHKAVVPLSLEATLSGRWFLPEPLGRCFVPAHDLRMLTAARVGGPALVGRTDRYGGLFESIAGAQPSLRITVRLWPQII